MRCFTAVFALLVAGSLGSTPARASLVINAIFDTSVTSLSYAASVESAFSYAAQQFENDFTDNITINIKISTMSTGLGGV